MHDANGQADAPTRGQNLLLITGSAGMLVAMATDAIAVLGRHIGFGFLGSIEIFQVAAVIALSSAILIASLQNRHARVDLILGRVSESKRRALAQIGRLALALTFGLLTAGSLWVAAELWPTHEMTESLSIRIAPFRAIWIISCALATLHFVVEFARGLRA
jgi:TRAP-type C4-dicarboxylate transport system permease small subunit